MRSVPHDSSLVNPGAATRSHSPSVCSVTPPTSAPPTVTTGFPVRPSCSHDTKELPTTVTPLSTDASAHSTGGTSSRIAGAGSTVVTAPAPVHSDTRDGYSAAAAGRGFVTTYTGSDSATPRSKLAVSTRRLHDRTLCPRTSTVRHSPTPDTAHATPSSVTRGSSPSYSTKFSPESVTSVRPPVHTALGVLPVSTGTPM